MANDGEVNIGTKIDESGLDKGIRSLTQKAQKAGSDIEKTAEKSGKETSEAVKQASESAAKAVEKAAKASKKSASYAEKNSRQLAESLKALEVEAQAKGEAVSAQAKYNVYLKSYIDLLTKSNGEIKKGMPIEQARLKQLKEAKKAAKEAADAEKQLSKTQKAAKSLKAALNETGGAASGFASKMGSVAASGGAAAAGISAAVLAAKKFIGTLKEANEAYEVQEKAEKALQKAAENNPYLNGESVRRLKEYAGTIQEFSNYGDEGTIDIMAQLAGTGRTEAEIMKIMGAAADYAAAKHIDLKTAAETLNSTYSGMAGTMGRQIADIKDLTDEQLKNGDAIDLIAKKYKGFAAEAADGSTQAKNTFGDFMESIGRIANPTFEALSARAKSFWKDMTGYMENFNDALEKARETWAIGGDYRWSKEFVKDINKNLKSVHQSKKTMYLEDNAESLSDENLRHLTVYLESQKKMNDNERQFLEILKDEKTHRENRAKAAEEYTRYVEKWRKASKEELQARQKTLTTTEYNLQELKAVNDMLVEIGKQEQKNQKEAQKTADDYAKASNEKLQESLNALEVEARAKGQSVSAQDKYNVYLQSYIDLLTKTEGAIREGYPIERKRLEQLKDAKRAVDEAADAEKKLAAAIELTNAAAGALESANRRLTPAAELEAEIKQLEEIKAKIEAMSEAEIAAAQKGQEAQLSKSELMAGLNEAERQATLAKVDAITEAEQSRVDKYASQQQQLLEMKKAINESEVLSEEEKINAIKALDESYGKSRRQRFADLATEIKGYTDQAVQIVQQAAQLQLDIVKNNATAEQAELEIKYRKGEISEEEYNEKLSESKKKAAKEQYKIQMWQWGASILQATANIAQGVSMAIAQGGVAGLITGALVGAAGAVQLASIIASKPAPPSFSTGGIVGGSSTHGDNIAANLNSREMVMNMGQQKALWDFINGGSNGNGGGANIVINNSASNVVRAQPQITKEKIEIMIDARVNDSLKNGRYNNSLNMAQQGMSGDYYGI